MVTAEEVLRIFNLDDAEHNFIKALIIIFEIFPVTRRPDHMCHPAYPVGRVTHEGYGLLCLGSVLDLGEQDPGCTQVQQSAHTLADKCLHTHDGDCFAPAQGKQLVNQVVLRADTMFEIDDDPVEPGFPHDFRIDC